MNLHVLLLSCRYQICQTIAEVMSRFNATHPQSIHGKQQQQDVQQNQQLLAHGGAGLMATVPRAGGRAEGSARRGAANALETAAAAAAMGARGAARPEPGPAAAVQPGSAAEAGHDDDGDPAAKRRCSRHMWAQRDQFIKITLRDETGADMLLRVRRSAVMGRVKEAFQRAKEQDPEEILLRCIFNGQRVNEDATCHALGLEDGDVIHLMVAQYGD